jgi:hypothetical protein
MPLSYTHDIIPRESPSRVLSTTTIVLFFLWLVCHRRAAYASSCFARITPPPSTTNVGQMKNTTLQFVVELTFPGDIFHQSTIFDRWISFLAAGSLSVVFIPRAVLQYYPVAINNICRSNKTTNTRIRSRNNTPGYIFDQVAIIDRWCIFPAAGSVSVVTKWGRISELHSINVFVLGV